MRRFVTPRAAATVGSSHAAAVYPDTLCHQSHTPLPLFRKTRACHTSKRERERANPVSQSVFAQLLPWSIGPRTLQDNTQNPARENLSLSHLFLQLHAPVLYSRFVQDGTNLVLLAELLHVHSLVHGVQCHRHFDDAARQLSGRRTWTDSSAVLRKLR